MNKSEINDKSFEDPPMLSPAGWAGIVSSAITIGGFVAQTTEALNIETDYLLLLLGVTGIIWIVSILNKLTSTISELRGLRSEIKNIQHLNIVVDGKDNVLKVQQEAGTTSDNSQGKTHVEGDVNLNGGDFAPNSNINKSHNKSSQKDTSKAGASA